MPSILVWPIALCIVLLCDIESFLPNKIANIVENVIIPSPPAWIRQSITNLPKGVKKLPVSFTVRPVTQVALVAVKTLSTNVALPAPVVAIGKLKSNAPIIITDKKLKTII